MQPFSLAVALSSTKQEIRLIPIAWLIVYKRISVLTISLILHYFTSLHRQQFIEQCSRLIWSISRLNIIFLKYLDDFHCALFNILQTLIFGKILCRITVWPEERFIFVAVTRIRMKSSKYNPTGQPRTRWSLQLTIAMVFYNSIGSVGHNVIYR